MRVSLVGTVHVERGTATVDALVALLARAPPEVVFAEIPSSHIARYKDGAHGTLESLAVARYAATESIAVVPVDAPAPSEEFFANDKHLFTTIERTSPEYRRLMDIHTAETRSGGFDHLNSTRCLDLWAAVYREAADTVEWLRDSHLRSLLKDWARVIEHRDRTMLTNILEFGIATGAKGGLLLVGTSHRRSLIALASAPNIEHPVRLEWDQASFLPASA